MPRKRRMAKRRADIAPAWAQLFESGFDFFHDLAPFGLHTDAAAREAAREAWAEFGEDFMRARDPREHVRPQPWAFEEYGDPERITTDAG